MTAEIALDVLQYLISVLLCSFATRSKILGFYKEPPYETYGYLPKGYETIATWWFFIGAIHRRINLWSLIPIVNIVISIYITIFGLYDLVNNIAPRHLCHKKPKIETDWVSSIFQRDHHV